MKNVEIFFDSLNKLCLFKRSSNAKECQMDFEKKVLRGLFPEAEIAMAVHVFDATIVESMTAEFIAG
ncbi:MAG TPA: hypothetical protein VGE06_13595, partial [Flavisolibacter sp.]